MISVFAAEGRLGNAWSLAISGGALLVTFLRPGGMYVPLLPPLRAPGGTYAPLRAAGGTYGAELLLVLLLVDVTGVLEGDDIVTAGK